MQRPEFSGRCILFLWKQNFMHDVFNLVRLVRISFTIYHMNPNNQHSVFCIIWQGAKKPLSKFAAVSSYLIYHCIGRLVLFQGYRL